MNNKEITTVTLLITLLQINGSRKKSVAPEAKTTISTSYQSKKKLKPTTYMYRSSVQKNKKLYLGQLIQVKP